MMMAFARHLRFLLCALLIGNINSWRVGNIAQVITPHRPGLTLKTSMLKRSTGIKLHLSAEDIIISPFDSFHGNNLPEKIATDTKDENAPTETLLLTLSNVESVLDEVRPHLQADGGDVVLQGITNDNIVHVTLVGACGSCPMATVTMKMGLEKTLKERIPSIKAVEQVAAPLPVLSVQAVEEVLEEVRQLVSVAGGTVTIVKVSDPTEPQPLVILRMGGTAAALQSVKIEIMQRIQKHFGNNVGVKWEV